MKKETYLYDAWGAILEENEDSSIKGINPFRYRGYVYDSETGLYYLQSRYYDPQTGRFINADSYLDTYSGSPLSTNMFAYCENNAVMKYDTTGEDAWWIQSPKSVDILGYKAGHTSLLIQEKACFWWYFYWGDNCIQLLFIGTTTQKELNSKINEQIQYWNKNKSKYISYPGLYNLPYPEQYTQSIRFSGNFTKIIDKIMNYLMDNMYGYYYTELHTDRRAIKYKVLSSFRMSSTYKYNGKTYKRPYSLILFGNPKYNVLWNNCVQKSIYFLQFGKLNKNNTEFQKALRGSYVIPNNAINSFKKFGKWAIL